MPAVLESTPAAIAGVDELDVMVVDDGSSERTVEVAEAHGVKHVVRHARTAGLARSFRDGVDYALEHGGDIVVNTDGDNQYPQGRIPDLLAPIFSGEADIVIAERQAARIAHFSPFKRLMQRVGTAVVNGAADTDLPDAASGFRAYSRTALLRLTIVTEFSYAMETIVQAGHKRLRIVSVPVETNPKTRESRLFRNDFQHMRRSGSAIVRSYLMFKPYGVFVSLAAVFAVLALVPMVRFVVLRAIHPEHTGNVQSLIFGAIMAVAALPSLALGVLADLLRTNRRILEHQPQRTKEIQYRR